ncbi:TonB-dependent receptor [Panacagrimonas sp.]|uniref:TonB-dependent receptor n=1 Tax=Panacagrimonas sp. TaxID=2480088 RepID=UPI003B51E6FF
MWMVPPLSAQESVSGQELRGRVLDRSGDVGFEGALVRIDPLGQETVTARDGRYRFLSVPPGEYTVRVEYLGAARETVPLTVAAGVPPRLDIRIGDDVLPVENILVVGQAAGQAGALNQQRAADSLRNIVSADAIGQFPDQNVAESLQRVPGLSIARDQGEGRFVIIRGIDPALSSTTINGLRVPGPESDSRQVNLDVISSDLLESLEVVKALTPDMDGDSVGGNVELKSATAFDRGNSLNLRGEGSYNDLAEEWSPKLAVSGTRLLSVGEGVENFGVAAAVSWFERDFGSDNVETAGFEDLEGPGGEFRGLEEAEQRDYTITRERLSAALNFDYRPSEATDLYWRTLYSDFSDDEVQLSNVYAFNTDEITGLSSSNGNFADSEIEKLNEARKETQQILSTAVGAENRLGVYTLDYVLGYAFAEEDNPNGLGAAFVGEGLDVGYDLSDREQPRLFSDDSAFADPSTYALDEIALESSFTRERETSAAFNVRRDIKFGSAPGYWKFGAKARLRDKEGNLDAEIYDGFGGDFSLADFPGQNVDYPLGNWGPILSRQTLRSFFDANRASFELNGDDSTIDSQLEDYTLDEDIYAGYAMARADIGRLRLVGGLRVERTEYDAQGTRLTIDEETGSGDPVIESLSAEKRYTDWLPSANLRFELNERTLLRAAVSRSIARPGFEQSSPRTAIEIEEDEGEFERNAEFGNPELDPLTSDNLDLAIEFYPGGVAVISAGLFYKRIKDFFVVSDIAGQPGTFENFDEAITTLNGDSADLLGAEFSYSQKFSFLPAPLDGFLLLANLTLTDSEASLPLRSDKAPLPRQSDTIGNLALGWEKRGVSLRLAATYRSEYLDEIGALDDPAFDRYADEHLQLDFIGSYRFGSAYQLYFNAVNLNDEPFYAYFQDRGFASQYEEYGPTYELGLKASF